MTTALLPRASKEAKLKKDLSCLAYKSPKKLKAFFQEYRKTTLAVGSNGERFTPWKGGSSDMARFRLWECSFGYVNPSEKLIVIGYLQDDAVVMVGTQSGKVYLDKDEIVYNVADTLSDFADQGCPQNPTFFDYYLARPNDAKSLPCAAGTYEDKDVTVQIPEEHRWPFIGHDPDELEADRQEARRMYAERADYFEPPPEEFLDFPEEDNQIQSGSFFAQFDSNHVPKEPIRSSHCQPDILPSKVFKQRVSPYFVKTKS
uniref:Uncharacterized protein n=1 Tax=Branchiostoma floridae TaxID=7739 RepID=C3Z364_BRAFL|eukprot:XP_002596896.1 hypothetical protein BRAFLDRAFT_76405 [Branchiostoma floridae]